MPALETPAVHPAIADALECIELEEQARAFLRDDYYHRLWRAIMLAPTLEICRALLRHEHVPISRLDPVWVRRFGLRRSA